ncbi:tRNA uridine-5-carboxymethylaminomethyl(34) synthesis GTPase MnmE [Lachnospiraceae bacterium NSJ-143]|nr:tRNA uridine-5-carboxymethylaminomethyl(34) synthesis GTPase MnmE [Lachnospiraceae bacterium NSJ-143]
MKTAYIDDIIAAPSTPPGAGGIGIIRVSGMGAVELVDKIFVSASGKRLSEKPTHTITYGNIVDGSGTKIDEVLVSIMRAPNSYTREDVAEINCHGGTASVKRVMEEAVRAGARAAEPGEFTKRAFLNGRIDLTQAEAVIDIINSKTELSMKNAVNQLSGGLSARVKAIRERLVDAVSTIEAAIDYPEHDIEEETYSSLDKTVGYALKDIGELLKTAEMGKMVRDGVSLVILGKPNVGKSSLLNFLLDEERAIVTDIPGTTRDTVEEYLNIAGIPVRITDTAGVRQTDDLVEKIGVERSVKMAENADLILLMLDSSRELDSDDLKLMEFLKGRKYIVIINKTDLSNAADKNLIEQSIGRENLLELSVKEKTGTDRLLKRLEEILTGGDIQAGDGVLVSNVRHRDSLESAERSLKKALDTIAVRMPEDFVSMDISEAIGFLGEITGESLMEDIINRIFEKFCLGK